MPDDGGNGGAQELGLLLARPCRAMPSISSRRAKDTLFRDASTVVFHSCSVRWRSMSGRICSSSSARCSYSAGSRRSATAATASRSGASAVACQRRPPAASAFNSSSMEACCWSIVSMRGSTSTCVRAGRTAHPRADLARRFDRHCMGATGRAVQERRPHRSCRAAAWKDVAVPEREPGPWATAEAQPRRLPVQQSRT